MQYLHFKKTFIKSCLFIVFCLTVFMDTAKAGLDYYEIYLGKKMLFQRYVNKPLSLESLPLSGANTNDQLVIHYYQCNAPGKLGTKRVITLKDDSGKTIKEWKFADAQASNAGMEIPVKELLQLEKTSKGKLLALFYTAEGRPEGEKLASLPASSKAVTYMYDQQIKNAENNFREALVCKAEVATIAGLIALRTNCLQAYL